MHTKSVNMVPEGAVSISWDKEYPTDGPFHVT